MTIIGFNPAREYNARMTNTLQNHVREIGFEVLEDNSLGRTMTEFIYVHPDHGTMYAYIQEVGEVSDAPGQKSIISDTRLTYREATDAMLREENR